MNKSQKTLALALGGAFAFSVATASVNAATANPFAATTLSSGYQVADAEKMQDGKCSAGKCGAEKMEKKADGKCGTGKCGAHKKAKEGSCSAEKMKEGACSAEKMKEGKCASGKCGAEKK